MGKPKGKVKIKWSPEFAYAIGLLTTDGCLSSDFRHIDLTSKDREQLENFLYCLKIENKISLKHSGSGNKYLRVQVGDVNFYKFLLSIGLTPKKSKTLKSVTVPSKYFFDFLRGSLDGDGCFYSYWDPRWRSSYMFYLGFCSASKNHIDWLQKEIYDRLKIVGHITKSKIRICYQLKYAKKDSLKLLKNVYYLPSVISLSRKKLKINKALAIIGEKI